MILSKTPLKIPLAGGLTDLKFYAERHGGITISTSIDKYVYVVLKENLGGYFRLKYTDVQEKVAAVNHIKHDLIRETIKLTKLEDQPLDIVIMSDLAGESGLGSSGAVTVGLLHAMHRFKGEEVSKQRLLEEASHIEVEVLAGASGYHDPSICSLGGLKRIDYQGQAISANDLKISQETLSSFQASLLFFYGGRHHKSKPSLDLLASHQDKAIPILHAIKQLAIDLEKAFYQGDLQLIAKLIGNMQEEKQKLPGHFVDDYVLDIVKRVKDVGAYAQLPGGKISAFVIVCCPDKQQGLVRKALADLSEIKIQLETQGSQVVEL